MRIDGIGRHDLAGRVHHRDLHAGAKARIEPQRRARAGGRGEQQVAQVAGEDPDAFVLGESPEAHPHIQLDARIAASCATPSARCRAASVAGTALSRDAERRRDAALVGACIAGLGARLVLVHAQVEDLFLLAAEQREDSVRGQLGQRLGEIEIIRELGALGLLAVADLRGEPAAVPI